MHLDTLVERFADLVVRAGANVQPGKRVYLTADLAHAAVVRAVVDKAYAAGAALVEVDWLDGPVRRSAVEHASLESLTASRSWMLDRYEGLDRDGAAVIVLAGDPHPGLMNGLDPQKTAAVRAEEESARRRMYLGGRATWCIAAVPNAGWAQQVFGEPDVERLWEAVSVPT